MSAASSIMMSFIPHHSCTTTRPIVDLLTSPVSTPGQAPCLFSEGKQIFSFVLMLLSFKGILDKIRASIPLPWCRNRERVLQNMVAWGLVSRFLSCLQGQFESLSNWLSCETFYASEVQK